MNPRVGYSAWTDHNATKHTLSVGLQFTFSEGYDDKRWLSWRAFYADNTYERRRGEQARAYMLVERIAQVLNAGMSATELYEIVSQFSRDDKLPSAKLPDKWFYWGADFDTDLDERCQCTHYFVCFESDECLIWCEDTFMEVYPAAEIGVERHSLGAIAVASTEVPNAQEEEAA